MSAGFHDFKVIQKDGTQFKTVMLDGQELQGVVSVKVDMEVDTLTKVTLEILSNKAEIDLKDEPMDIEEKDEEAWDKPVYTEEKYDGKCD